MPPGKVMSIDSVKINPSLVMMRECKIQVRCSNYLAIKGIVHNFFIFGQDSYFG